MELVRLEPPLTNTLLRFSIVKVGVFSARCGVWDEGPFVCVLGVWDGGPFVCALGGVGRGTCSLRAGCMGRGSCPHFYSKYLHDDITGFDCQIS